MMTMDEARLEAHRRWFASLPMNRGCVWHTASGRRAVGFTDGEFRYAMGTGDTWEEAFADAAERMAKHERR